LYDQFEGQKASFPTTSELLANASPVSGSPLSVQKSVGFDPIRRLDLLARLFDTLFEPLVAHLITAASTSQVGSSRQQETHSVGNVGPYDVVLRIKRCLYASVPEHLQNPAQARNRCR
jgi:hypothetical protein